MFKFIVCVGAGVIAGNLAFDATNSLMTCGLMSFAVSFLMTFLWER